MIEPIEDYTDPDGNELAKFLIVMVIIIVVIVVMVKNCAGG